MMKRFLTILFMLISLMAAAQKKKEVKDTVQASKVFVLQGDWQFFSKLLYMLQNPSKNTMLDVEAIRDMILEQLDKQVPKTEK